MFSRQKSQRTKRRSFQTSPSKKLNVQFQNFSRSFFFCKKFHIYIYFPCDRETFPLHTKQLTNFIFLGNWRFNYFFQNENSRFLQQTIPYRPHKAKFRLFSIYRCILCFVQCLLLPITILIKSNIKIEK